MNLKREKGITLIALVITIIVLLILAGVTISMVLGDEGIISNAQKAKEDNEQKTFEETVKLGYLNYKTKKLTPTTADDEEVEIVVENALKDVYGDKINDDNKVDITEGTEKITVKLDINNDGVQESCEIPLTQDGNQGGNGGTTAELISFTIDGTEYKAEPGMTWDEWNKSGFSGTDKMYRYPDTCVWLIPDGESYAYELCMECGCGYCYSPKWTDTIEDTLRYTGSDCDYPDPELHIFDRGLHFENREEV